MTHPRKEIVQFSVSCESKRHFLRLLRFQVYFEGHRCQHDQYVPSLPGRTKPAPSDKVLRSSFRMVTTAKNFNSEDGAARKSKILGADSLKITRTENKIKGHNLHRNIKLLFC